MSGEFHFIEVESEKPCWYCRRRKLNEDEKFYKVFVGDNDLGVVVCEFCKGGFLTRMMGSPEKTYATHLIFYVKRSVSELKEKLPGQIIKDLDIAIQNYENGEYVASFRSIGYVAEWLTGRLFDKKIGKLLGKEKLSWDGKLGRLLAQSRKDKKTPQEALIYELYSMKWFRNKADHPSEYKITGEDVRLGLISIVYLIHQIYAMT